MYMHIPEYPKRNRVVDGVGQTTNKGYKVGTSTKPSVSASPLPESALFFPECVHDGINELSQWELTAYS
jgi:hypothetical protein